MFPLYFALSAHEENLDEFAQTGDGRRMLQRMESELLSGFSRIQEQPASPPAQAGTGPAEVHGGRAGAGAAAPRDELPVSTEPGHGDKPEPSLSAQQALERLRLIGTVLDGSSAPIQGTPSS